LINLINKEGIDIVCAQELSIGLAEALSGELPFGNMSHEQIARGNGIASRYPVEMGRIRMPKRDGWVARLSPQHWQNLPFLIEVVNVHLSGPHLWPYFPNPVRRRAQLEALGLACRTRYSEISTLRQSGLFIKGCQLDTLMVRWRPAMGSLGSKVRGRICLGLESKVYFE
jgi:hypothetical protein